MKYIAIKKGEEFSGCSEAEGNNQHELLDNLLESGYSVDGIRKSIEVFELVGPMTLNVCVELGK